MKVVKKSGDIVDFDAGKLKKSLLRSGVAEVVADAISSEITQQLYPGMKTRQIYRIAEKMLKKVSAVHAARYNLRAGIRQLGPAGFFFEKFISQLFLAEGFETQTNLKLKGICVSHEIDILLLKNRETTMVECKFHAKSETVSDVKVPMYILSRFNDLKSNSHLIFSGIQKLDRCMIVTNNRFTTDAMVFAKCSGLELLSWDYPDGNSLKAKIDREGLYPITCLTTLSMLEKEKLLILNVITVKQLIEMSGTLSKIGISPGRQENILNEATGLCKYLST